ncbi:glycosyltransferase [Amnibacterium sp. CER49]|uniref:glycosyltransferase n=1 Tax=Amnibacterium sp. CER49 TaxID=3039161 RepID=UPI00244B80A7|nr:glycosyltransferase [Amnibacterium sp. CER49]MDH2445221.1 glycosyltransferase [Amnibacterium sp. CER49]
MEPTRLLATPAPAEEPVAPADPPRWQRVHDVVGPLADRRVPPALYVSGALPGAVRATPTGRRHDAVVPAGGAASFGSYFNAFPAAYWADAVGSRSVRLDLTVDAPAVVTVRRKERDADTVVTERMLEAGEQAAIEVAIDACREGGTVWFELHAGPRQVRLVDAAWSVREAPRREPGLVVGMPTIGRAEAIALNLARIASAPALVAVLRRAIVVDQGADPLDADAVRTALPAVTTVLRQANLGGSGGYSRVLHEARSTDAAGTVTLLDDDIEVEPASLLRAYEFGLRTAAPSIVGLQMLDAAVPGVLECGAERVARRTFWWHAADDRLPGADLARVPAVEQPGLQRRTDADFAGWWACQLPLEAVRRLGYALPFFLKWDDAEYGLRAAAAGVPTVSLPGAAVWHETWRTKDDSRSWPAFFHARNRLIAALLHGGRGTCTGVLGASLALDLKQALAMQHYAVQRRHDGLRAVLEGPEALFPSLATTLPQLLALAAGAPEQRRHRPDDLPAAPDAPVTPLAPLAAPRGTRLALWAAVATARHLLVPAARDTAPTARLSPARGTWWVVPAHDNVLVPTGDGAAYYWHRRDRRGFAAALAESVLLHAGLALRWRALERRYRLAAPGLAAPEAWAGVFAAAAE